MLTNKRIQQPNRRITGATPLLHSAFLGLLAICILAFSPAAGAQEAAKQAPDSKKVSGFLGDYSGLAPDPKNGDLLVYVKDRSILKKSHKFILDPVTVYLLPSAQNRGVDPDELARLAKYFHDAVADELASGAYEIVTTPGPDVLELNMAITNVVPNGGGKNAVVKGAATAASVAAAPGVSLLVPRISVGKVSIEGEFLESASRERVAAFVTSKSGRRYFAGLNTVKKWGDIEAAFRSWAKELRKRLDGVHAD